MIRRLILILLAAGSWSAAFGQDKALFYQVSGKDLKEPSYLFGTFHMVCPNDLDVAEATRKALSATDQLFLELDFDDPLLQQNMMKSMTVNGPSLRDILKPEDYAVLDAYIQQNLGAGLAQMPALKPIALLSVMYVSMLKCQPASYDLTFAQLAGQQGKPVLGLETLEEQLAAIDQIPMEEQLKGLVEMARRPDEAQKEILALLAAY
jgi:uncharacterized protein